MRICGPAKRSPAGAGQRVAMKVMIPAYVSATAWHAECSWGSIAHITVFDMSVNKEPGGPRPPGSLCANRTAHHQHHVLIPPLIVTSYITKPKKRAPGWFPEAPTRNRCALARR